MTKPLTVSTPIQDLKKMSLMLRNLKRISIFMIN